MLQLLEDVSTPIKPQIIYKTTPGVPPKPTDVPQTSELPQKPRQFKQRVYSLGENPEHKLELKRALLSRIKDPELIEQFKLEIKELIEIIQEKKGE